MKITRQAFTTAQGRNFQVTYWTLTGTRPGPVLTIIAGQHGMEHTGPCLLPEFAAELADRDFAGTVHICPCANPLALEMDYEFYPEREDLSKIKDYYYSRFRHNFCPWGLGRSDAKTMYNMNRLWNRTGDFGVAGQITAWLWQEIAGQANIILDLHCHQARKPLIFNSEPKNLPIARYAGIEAVVMTNPDPEDWSKGNLTWQGSRRHNSYAICFEFSVQHALGEFEYEFGKQAIRNIMVGANMLPGEVVLSRPVWVIPFNPAADQNAVLKSNHTGHIRYCKNLYDWVKKGEKIYEIRDLQTVELLEEGFATRDGIMAGIAHQPIITPEIRPCYVAQVQELAPAGLVLPKLPADFFA